MRTLLAEGEALEAAETTHRMTLTDDVRADFSDSELKGAVDMVRARLVAQYAALGESISRARVHTDATAAALGVDTIEEMTSADRLTVSQLIEVLAGGSSDNEHDDGTVDPIRVPPQTIAVMEEAGVIERDSATGRIRCHPLLRRGVSDSA